MYSLDNRLLFSNYLTSIFKLDPIHQILLMSPVFNVKLDPIFSLQNGKLLICIPPRPLKRTQTITIMLMRKGRERKTVLTKMLIDVINHRKPHARWARIADLRVAATIYQPASFSQLCYTLASNTTHSFIYNKQWYWSVPHNMFKNYSTQWRGIAIVVFASI